MKFKKIRLEKWQEALDIIEMDDTEIKDKKSLRIEKGIKVNFIIYLEIIYLNY